MSWSLRLGRLAGIPVYVHWTFLILLGFIGLSEYQVSGQSITAALEGVGLVCAVFGCVVLHELGHALVARQFGIPTLSITMLPIGGVARLQRMPEYPPHELLVAIAGPAVNVVIALTLAAVMFLTGTPFQTVQQAGENFMAIELPFLSWLIFINLFLVVFNLIPAFPMDGGRILRALLAMTMPYAQATRVAASVGQVMAILFAFFGLMNPPFIMLLLIALFVWIGAEAEAQQAEERVSLRGASVRDAMLTDYETLSATDPLSRAADLLLAGSQRDFPVLGDHGHRPVGVLTREGLIRGLKSAGLDAPVGQFVQEGLGEVPLESPLVQALTRLRGGEGPCLLVVDGAERPVGLLTSENISEFLMVRGALEGLQGHAARPTSEQPTEGGPFG